MRKFTITIILLTGWIVNVSAQEVQKYTNQTVNVMSGPGAVYDRIMQIYKDSEVTSDSIDGYWEYIFFEGSNGWVPSFTLNSQVISETNEISKDEIRTRSLNALSMLNGVDTEVRSSANSAQVAAAVKGFARKYVLAKNLESAVNIDEYLDESFSVSEYQKFIRDRRNQSRLKNKARLLNGVDWRNNLIDLTIVEPIGYTLATVIAQKGIVRTEAQKYLNLLTNYIVSISHRPDLVINTLILDSDEMEGYSLPGNYIFISSEALKAMLSEDELVHFLSHEVAHLVFAHGIKEMKDREIKINAQDAYLDLESEFQNSEISEFEQELTSFVDEFFDYINKDRLEAYEIEADYWGVVYTYLAGYNAHSLKSFLQRMDSDNVDGKGEWSRLNLVQRLNAIEVTLTRLNIPVSSNSRTSEFAALKSEF